MSDTDDQTRLSKMQKIRKRELRRAITRLHECLQAAKESGNGWNTYGLRVAIGILGDMRKEINAER